MYNLLKLNLGRNSLRYVIREYKIKEINIPYYLCNSVRKSIIKEGCKPVFYHIDDNFFPLKSFDMSDFILYPDYFGICGKNVQILTKKYPNLIMDNSHSFFSQPSGLACFNSARKFLPVYNGSYLWIKSAFNTLNNDKIYRKSPENEYENIKNENDFENFEVLNINKKVLKDIENLDIEDIKQKRLSIFKEYNDFYKNQNLLNIDFNNIVCPFGYPFLAENEKIADNLVKKLNNKNITVYRYWENLPDTFIEYKFYKRLVIIPLK